LWDYDVSPVDAQFATLAEDGIWIRDINTQARQIKLESLDADGNEDVHTRITYSLDGTVIVAHTAAGALVIFDLVNGDSVSYPVGYDQGINYSEISPNGRLFATAGCDAKDENGRCTAGSAKVWDVASGDLLLIREYDQVVSTVSFSPDNKIAAISKGFDTAVIWDLEADETIAELIHSDNLAPIFNPDGKSVLLRDGFKIGIWDIEFQYMRAELIGHLDVVTQIEFSPDGENIITSSWDGTARVWNAQTGIESLLVDEHTSQVYSAGFSPNGDRIFTASEDGTAIIWPYSIDRLLEMTSPLIQRSIPVLTPEEIMRLGLLAE
jgi:WD40 repeat protein